jgi:hypothetical protein
MEGVLQQARGSFTSFVSTGGFLQAATPFYLSTALDILSMDMTAQKDSDLQDLTVLPL